jgi:hypothetical protein
MIYASMHKQTAFSIWILHEFRAVSLVQDTDEECRRLPQNEITKTTED